MDLDDVIYLVREIWRGVSARSMIALMRQSDVVAAPRLCPPGGDKGLMRSTARLVLTRWDVRQPARVDNLVLLSFEEAEAHEGRRGHRYQMFEGTYLV